MVSAQDIRLEVQYSGVATGWKWKLVLSDRCEWVCERTLLATVPYVGYESTAEKATREAVIAMHWYMQKLEDLGLLNKD